MLLNDRIYFTYYLELDFHCPEIDKWVDLIWDNFEWDDEEDDSVWSLEGEERAWEFLKNNSTKKWRLSGATQCLSGSTKAESINGSL